MPMDDEKVKAALDDFEEEKFSDAKEKLADEIKKARDEFLKNKLNLKGDEVEEPEGDDTGDEDEKKEEPEGDDTGDEDGDDKKATKKRVAKAIKKKQEKE